MTLEAELYEEWEEFCVEYLENMWFQHIEYFVLTWTNRIKHRGNNAMNRAKGSHGKLKTHFDSCIGSFPIVFGAMNNMLNNQLTKIKATFDNSIALSKLFHNGMPY